MCDIKLILTESIPPDSGIYRLVHVDNATDTDLGLTNLTVQEIPLKVLSELSTCKPEYLNGEDIKVKEKNCYGSYTLYKRYIHN